MQTKEAPKQDIKPDGTPEQRNETPTPTPKVEFGDRAGRSAAIKKVASSYQREAAKDGDVLYKR